MAALVSLVFLPPTAIIEEEEKFSITHTYIYALYAFTARLCLKYSLGIILFYAQKFKFGDTITINKYIDTVIYILNLYCSNGHIHMVAAKI